MNKNAKFNASSWFLLGVVIVILGLFFGMYKYNPIAAQGLSVINPGLNGYVVPYVSSDKIDFNDTYPITVRVQTVWQQGSWARTVVVGETKAYIDGVYLQDIYSWRTCYGSTSSRWQTTIIDDNTYTFQTNNLAAGQHKLCIKTYQGNLNDCTDPGSNQKVATAASNFDSCTDLDNCEYASKGGEDCFTFNVYRTAMPQKNFFEMLWDSISSFFSGLRWGI